MSALPAAVLAAGMAFLPAGVPVPSPETLPAHVEAANPAVPVVVLGAQLDEFCLPPAVLHRRLDAAADFVRLHPANTIIVSGGVTRSHCPSEAAVMEAGLRARLVPNPIQQEADSHSTVENARNVSRMTSHAVLVTSDYHLPRAIRTFTEQHVDVVGVPAH